MVLVVEDLPANCQCRRCKRHRFDPWVRKIPWRRKWQPAPVLLPGKSHGQRSLADYSPWDCKKSDTTEQLHFSQSPFTLSSEAKGWKNTNEKLQKQNNNIVS